MPQPPKPLKIAMITNRYLPIVGGAEMQANHLSHQLAKRGHHVQVITRRIHPEYPIDDVINEIPVHRLSPIGLGHRANALMFFRMFIYLLFNARHYDVMHVHSMGPLGLATLIVGKLTRTASVMKIPSNGDLSRSASQQSLSSYTKFIRRYILPQWLWRRLISYASALIVLSDALVEEAKNEGFDNIAHKIPNGVDVGLFHPLDVKSREVLRGQLSIGKDKVALFFSGRLISGKRVDVAIDALVQIIHDYPNCKLYLAGSGKNQHDSVEDMLKQQVIDNNLQDHVIFLGNIDNIPEYLQVVDGFIFPSASEGLPNAVLEAMACGLPIIASRIPTLVDLLSDEMAYHVDVGDVDGFAQSIKAVIENPDIAGQKGRNVLQEIQDKYTIEVVAQTYEELYYDLLP